MKAKSSVAGRRLQPGQPQRVLAAGAATVPGERARFGVFPNLGVRTNMTISLLERHRRWGRIDRERERQEVNEWIGRLGIVTQGPDAPIQSLSGGNQQKVLVARALRTRPKVLVLDDPTQGIDVGARAQIHEVIERCAADGIGILLISTDSDELARLSDRILIMAGGRCARTLERGPALTAKLIDISQLEAAPEPAFAARSLRRRRMNTMTAPPVQQAGTAGKSSHLRLPGLRNFSAVYLWIVFLILFGVLQFHLFLTVSTFQVVFSQSAVTAVLALAFLVPLTADTYDLSIGEMMSLTIVLMNWLTLHTTLPIGVIAVLVVLTCAVIGAVSGFIVVKLRVNSLIATLGMSEVLSSIQLYISQNHQVSGSFSSLFVQVGNGKVLGIPYLDLYMIVIALVLWFVLEQTPVGRRMFAVGGNREAARLAGISADRIIWGSLIASAAIASVAGVMYTAQVGAYTSDIGQGYLFPALAAVFFGASQLSQRPNVWGTLIAYFALAFGIQGLTLQFGAGTFWVSPLFQGVAVIGAVAIASSRGAIGAGGDSRAIRRLLRSRGSAQPTGTGADSE